MNSTVKNPDIEALYLFLKTVKEPELRPQLGKIIAALSEESHPSTLHRYGTFNLDGLEFTVDVSDRFGRACFYGSDQEQTDLAVFTSLCGKNSVVWDIGANFGLYAVACAPIVGEGGQVYAAEPNRNVFGLLKANIKANGFWGRVFPYDCAISDKDGEAIFYEANESAFSGLSDTGRAQIEQMHTVTTSRLDTLWRNKGRVPVDLIKIDVEGHEGAVFEGALETMEASPNLVLQFEFSPKNLDEEKIAQLRDILFLLEGKGWNFWFHSREAAKLSHTAIADIFAKPEDYAGNLFMVRAGSAREAELQSRAAQALSREPEPFPPALFQPVLKIISKFRDLELFYELQARTEVENTVRQKLAYLNPDLRALKTSEENAQRTYPDGAPDGGKVTSLTVMVKVTGDEDPLRDAIRAARHLFLGLPGRLVITDARPFPEKPLVAPEAMIVAPPLTTQTANRFNRYAIALRAALATVATSHVLLVEATAMPNAASVRMAVAEWNKLGRSADYKGTLAAIAFPRKDAQGEVWLEETLGGMPALRGGLISVAALHHSGLPADDLYYGDGFDLDLSLRLCHAGLDILPASTRAAVAEVKTPVRHAEDDKVLAEQWSGIYAHPLMPELFKRAGWRKLET